MFSFTPLIKKKSFKIKLFLQCMHFALLTIQNRYFFRQKRIDLRFKTISVILFIILIN